jgi:rfaE bifunctional protein kinase chain/domain
VIFSDYGKGALKHIPRMIEMAKTAGKITLVDPKGGDYSKYAGSTVITPNRSELRQVIGKWTSEADLTQKAQQLRTQLGLEAILLTRSEEGMTLFRENQVSHVGAQAREVFDVSGAGDTVIGTLAVALASGWEWDQAMALANRAGGIVVGKLGTATVSAQELS